MEQQQPLNWTWSPCDQLKQYKLSYLTGGPTYKYVLLVCRAGQYRAVQGLNLSINQNLSYQNHSGFQQDHKLTVETGHSKSWFIYILSFPAW